MTATEIIEGLIDGQSIESLLKCTRGALKNKKEALKAELEGELSQRHAFLLQKIQAHIAFLKEQVQEVDEYIFEAMKPYHEQWKILQTIPGIDAVSAALIIIEIGVDMQQFGNREQFCS